MELDYKRYIANYIACRFAHSNQTKKQGFLNPLPIPAYPIQHIYMDFKEFPRDKHRYNCLFIIIDRLGKDLLSILCYKTINAYRIAELFV